VPERKSERKKEEIKGGRGRWEDELPKQLVKELEPGSEVKSTFIVARKELRKTKAGAAYLAVELVDKSGRVEARLWDQVNRYKDTFAERDYVAVSGRVEKYRDQKQVVITSLRRRDEEEVDASDFLRVVGTDRAELEGELRLAVEEVRNLHLRALLLAFLNDADFMKAFTSAPAAKNYHHPYLGGLLEHTASTVHICRIICDLYPEIDRDLLISAATLHDIGKIEELEYDRGIDFTDAGRFLGHLLLSDEMIREKIKSIPGFPRDLAMRLRHAVLSHHGELEWGSPKRPKTLEAIVLHHVDNLDAKVNSFREVAERAGDSDSPWTDMRNLFKRPLYIPRAISQEMELQLEEDVPH
jgi:3'-5' exoribonuclease